MSTPAEAAGRFAAVCLLGLVLGAVYGFLRPLRRRHVHIADSIFLLCFTRAWLEAGFRICQGDLRIGYALGLFPGIFLWELTAGKLLRPVIDMIWKGIWKILGIPRYVTAKFFKKIAVFVKKYLHLEKNRVQ